MSTTTGAPAREATLSAAGLKIFVRQRGDGHPLLLINGLGANAEMWGAVERSLSSVARTIVFDLPGNGRSTTPTLPLPVQSHARVALGILDELGHDRADVLGFSFGGLVAQELARYAPGRVRRMALVATACGWGSKPGTIEALALISMPWRYYSRSAYEQTNWLLSPADADLVARLPELAAARLRHPPPLAGYAFQLAAGMLWSSLPWLHTVQVPTLVIAGGRDHLIPGANGVQLARLLPRSRLHLLPEDGHLAVYDPESRMHPLLADFLGSGRLRDAPVWMHGTVVDDDETVEAAFRDVSGAEPIGLLSDAFRWAASRQTRCPTGPAVATPTGHADE